MTPREGKVKEVLFHVAGVCTEPMLTANLEMAEMADRGPSTLVALTKVRYNGRSKASGRP